MFPKNANTDIAALATDCQIAPKFDILVEGGGQIIGQDSYFLGFPFGLHTPFREPSTHAIILIPFVKKAIFSAMDSHTEDGHILYLDGHNNPGFSGGPVIFANHYKKNRLQISEVIAGYRNQPLPVLEKEIEESTSPTGEKQKKVIRYVQENSGIVVAYGIEDIVSAIRENPIGFPLPESPKRFKP